MKIRIGYVNPNQIGRRKKTEVEILILYPQKGMHRSDIFIDIFERLEGNQHFESNKVSLSPPPH